MDEQGPGCTNVECHNGFVYQQGAYLAPGNILDGGNHMTIKFLKVIKIHILCHVTNHKRF